MPTQTANKIGCFQHRNQWAILALPNGKHYCAECGKVFAKSFEPKQQERDNTMNTTPALSTPRMAGTSSTQAGNRASLSERWGVLCDSVLVSVAIIAGVLFLMACCSGCINTGDGRIVVNTGWRSAQSELGDTMNETDGGGSPALTIPVSATK